MTSDAPLLHLILGATGKTGRRLVSTLAARGERVRPAARPQFDWDDRATWTGVLEGASTAYIAYAPDLALPGAPETVEAFTARAAAAGLRRVVLLSGRNEPEALRAERLVAEVASRAGVEWAVVRSAFFWQNFTEGLFSEGIARGRLRFTAGDVREPFIDADDVAAVAAALLTGDAPSGRVYDVTGPRLLTFAEATAEVGDLLGTPVAYEHIGFEELVADLLEIGVDADSASGVAELFDHVLDGRNAFTSPGVREALGRDARGVPAVQSAAPVVP